MDANYKQMMEKQDVEFFQLALIATLRKVGGLASFTKAEILDAGRFMGDITQIHDKWVIKIVPKPADFDEVKANEFFEQARVNSAGINNNVPQVS